jgi:hypothetical protein
VETDPVDPDGQSLLLWYPSATVEGNEYIRRAIKIESGAKSALDPHAPVVVKPYISDDLPNLDLAVGNVTTVDPSRTFWDKVVILHGLRRWWDRRGELKGGGQRVSRHYYDEAMSGMIFGSIPTVDEVVTSISKLERFLNLGSE